MRHLDLFSGIGGFSLAFERHGFETVGFSEIDPYASAVLKKHWPEVKNYGDIRNITRATVKEDITIITGGFPCQPFSVAGARGGDSDERFLWPELLRVVSELRPAFALFENVPGLLSIDGGRTFNRILSDIVSIGYDCLWNLVPACAAGANHRRDRLWIIAYSRHHARSAKQECECEASPKELAGMCEADVANSQGSKDGRFGVSELHQRNSRMESSGGGKRLDHLNSTNNLANSSGEGLEGRKEALRQEERRIFYPRHNRQDIGSARGNDWWAIEPDMGRVAHGIPKRVDRLKCLGNSIVPQVAEIFAKGIAPRMKPRKKGK